MSTILFLLLGTARLARSFPLGEVLSFLKGVSLARFKPCLTHEVTPFFPFCLSLLQLFHTHVKHTPLDKLYDAFIAMLAGAHGLVEINSRLRADAALQEAFGR